MEWKWELFFSAYLYIYIYAFSVAATLIFHRYCSLEIVILMLSVKSLQDFNSLLVAFQYILIPVATWY